MTRSNNQSQAFSTPAQSSMFEAFAQAEQEARTAHLPASMEEAIPFYRRIIERFHAAILRCDVDEARPLYEEAHELAAKLNGGDPCGICATGGMSEQLEIGTDGPAGQIPMYGQRGNFITEIDGVPVRIEMDGIFGIGSFASLLPGFSANAVDYAKRFISETGYRSFLGCSVALEPGTTPAEFARLVIAQHVKRSLKGKLIAIKQEYIDRQTLKENAPDPQP